jgi:hypothetical protein
LAILAKQYQRFSGTVPSELLISQQENRSIIDSSVIQITKEFVFTFDTLGILCQMRRKSLLGLFRFSNS